MEKPALTTFPINDLIRRRWSPRTFSPQPLDCDTLLSLFEAARWAPSSRNGQPWSFIAVTRGDAEQFAAFLDVLSPSNAVWAKQAPALILSVANLLGRDGQPTNTNALYDLGLAVGNLIVQATSAGLVARQMGGFDKGRAREVFGIPFGHAPVTAIAVGYPGSLESLPEDMRAGELATRTRKPLEAFVYGGRWQSPFYQE